MNKKRIIYFAALLFCAFSIPFFCPDKAAALKYTDGGQMLRLALLDGVATCYKKGNEYIKNTMTLAEFNVTSSYPAYPIMGSKAGNDGSVWIPTGIANSISDSELSCTQVFTGYPVNDPGNGSNSTYGLNQLYANNIIGMNTLESWGYVKRETDNGSDVSNQARISFSVKGSNGNLNDLKSSEMICTGQMKHHNPGFFDKNDYDYWLISSCTGSVELNDANDGGISGFYTFKIDDNGDSVSSYGFVTGVGDGLVTSPYDDSDNFRTWLSQEMKCTTLGCTFASALKESKIISEAKKSIETIFFYVNGNEIPTVTPNVSVDRTTNISTNYTFFSNDSSNAAHIAMRNISGETNGSVYTSSDGLASQYSVYWGAGDTYSLYYMYLEKVINDPDSGLYVKKENCGSTKPSGFDYMYKNSADTWCGITKTSNSYLSNTYAVVQSGHLTKGTFQDVLDWFKNEDNYKYFEDSYYANAQITDDGQLNGNTTNTGSNLSGTNELADVCLKNSSADSMSWIVCPAVGGLAEGSDGLYGSLKDMLSIDSSLISQISEGGDSATYMAWGFFRDIANIIFVAIILVIIFSQVTGVGIDNYGIKKMLPKIIVTAILINLSFVISQLAVDLSNVCGEGLSLLFSSISNEIERRVGFNASIPIIGAVGSGAVITLAGGTYAAAQIVPVVLGFLAGGVAGWIMLIPLIIGLLVAIISILLFFVMLSLQKMLVIVCVVLSPLAFICYTLPNTQSIFKQWLKIFEAMLLLFPICSLLYGVGTLIQVIIFSAGSSGIGLWMAILAFVAPMLPFLLAPSLLKKSMSLAGDIGARVQGVGQATQRGLRNGAAAFRNTEHYKDAQRSADMARQQRIVNRTTAALGRTNLSDRQRARYTRRGAMASQRLEKYRQEDIAASTLMDRQQHGNETLDEVMARWEAAYTSGSDDLESLTYRVMEFGSTGAGRIGTVMANHDNISTDANLQRSIQTLRHVTNNNSSFASQMKSKASDAFNAISSGGRGHAESAPGVLDETSAIAFRNFSHFGRNNSVATDLSDWSTQSAATLRRALSFGTLNAETAQALLTSEDPSIQSGIASDPSKRDVLQAAVYNASHMTTGQPIPEATAAQRFREEQAAAEEVQHIQESYRATGNEVITATPAGGGDTVTFTGHTPRQPGFSYQGVDEQGDHIYRNATGDSWNSETGTLTINHGPHINQSGFRFLRREADGSYTFRHADGRTYNSSTDTITPTPTPTPAPAPTPAPTPDQNQNP